MNNKEITGKSYKNYFEEILLILIYFIAGLLSYEYEYLTCIILVLSGVGYYFFYSLKAEKSFISLNAVFSASWFITIGIANLRLLEYQVAWGFYTWLLLAISHLVFVHMNNLSKDKFNSFTDKIKSCRISSKLSNLSIDFNINENRYFYIATIVTLIGLAAFLINVYIKGYIPIFEISKNPAAYVDFYTRFHTFVVASTVSGGLSYYTIKTVKLTKLKKAVLIMNITISVFMLPILLVQRGTFVNAALILACVIYFLSNKKLIVIVSSLMVIFAIYILGSSLRGYSNDQLEEFFPQKEPTEVNPGNENVPGEPTFTIPPKIAFVYTYLTVSHDNFNSAVIKNDEYTFGLWQFEPFNVVLNLDFIDNKLTVAENRTVSYRVLPHLTSFNLITNAFYDFGLLGVILFMSIWSFSFGLVEEFCRRYKGIYSKLTYGVILSPVALSFMNPWLSLFPIWLMWGTIFLMFLASSINFRKRGKTK